MFPYWLLFGFFAMGALFQQPMASGRPRPNIMIGAGAVAMILMIGLRYKVGADWESYRRIFREATNAEFTRALGLGDPGYEFVNWTAGNLGLGIWAVNLVCAIIFIWGLMRFAATQPNRWLAVAIAVPYMVIVVAMGYSRQGAALGVILAGLADFLKRGSVMRLAFYTVVAALFHSTAVVVFPLVALAAQRSRIVNLLIAAAVGYLLYDIFIRPSLDTFVDTYLVARYNSQGAAIRVGINAIAAVALLAGGRRLAFTDQERAIWRNFAWAALGLVAALILSPSSTAVDRLAIYVMPLQIAAFGRLAASDQAIGPRMAVLAYSAAVLFVWLFFAGHSQYWLPYRSYLF